MRKGYDDVYLVTGFPNFRAEAMVNQLANEGSRSLLYVLIRVDAAREAEEAVAKLPKAARARVVPIEGDAASMDLGLSGKEYKRLAGEVTRIHHVAQATYAGDDRRIAERMNLGGTREIIEFGRLAEKLKMMVIHSSAMVSGNRTGLVLEADLNAGQSFRSPVEETLARAERLVRSYTKELPIAVLRPTQIVGHSRTGEVDRFDGPYMLILLLVSSPQELPVPLPTRGDAPMHLVPIDYVVRAAHRIGLNDGSAGRTFHIADSRPLTVRRVFELVARAGGKRLPSGFIPTNLTRALLRAPGLHALARSPRAFLEQIATQVRYDTRNTEEALRGTGIACPPFESYVDELVAYVKRRVQQQRVRSEEAEVEDPLV
jgi:thioester reductase-like protein